MKRILPITLGLIGFAGVCFAQSQSAQTAPLVTDSAALAKMQYVIVEEMPEFPGGMQGLSQFISRNLKYPKAARKARVQGTVRVTFVIGTSGQVENPEILDGLSHGCNEKVVRLVNQMPLWTPGKQDGKPVAVRYAIPIRFIMQ